jgi:membrane-bound lytic murein transglycosylase B
MKLADKNNLDIENLNGSWAGAMGHFQFIPTTLEQYGADGNGDGKIDIINSVGDAMFSAGNYLSKLGWNPDERIVRRVSLPAGFDTTLCDGKTKKPLAEWRAMGVAGVPNSTMVAGMVCDKSEDIRAQSAEVKSSKLKDDTTNNFNLETSSLSALRSDNFGYLTYPNFYRVKQWNNSNWYAIAVAELAEKLK